MKEVNTIQTKLFDDTLPFAGSTYEAKHDEARLTSQLQLVKALMSDKKPRTLSEIQAALRSLYGIYATEAGISARLRDLRKEQFGGYTVERNRRGEPRKGLWEYRLV